MSEPQKGKNKPAKDPKADGKETAAADATQGKSKAQLRAERREKQEAQRAAKAQRAKDGTPKPKGEQKSKQSDPKKPPEEAKPKVEAEPCTQEQPAVVMPQRSRSLSESRSQEAVHEMEGLKPKKSDYILMPGIMELGRACITEAACDTAQSVALLRILQRMIEQHTTSKDKDSIREIEQKLRLQLLNLKRYTPLSNGMGNAVRHLKKHMSNLAEKDSSAPDKEVKLQLNDCIERFINEKILMAGRAISEHCRPMIADDSVILTVGLANVVCQVLVDARKNGTNFRVMLADSGPKFLARQMLKGLGEAGIECTYVLCNAIPYIMSKVTMVFVGAHSLLANGSVVGPAGTTTVALLAKDFNIPVYACCESYKFSEKVQSQGFNVGNPDALATGLLADWRSVPNLTLVNYSIDVTPFDLITNVITEQSPIPCTAAPALLRILQDDTRRIM